MRTIAGLFGRSPFKHLQEHMNKVAECIEKLPPILDAHAASETERVLDLAREVSKLEHEADLLKNDIRDHLPRGLFMPVDRTSLTRIISLQDTIADSAENVAVILTFKASPCPEPIRELLGSFLSKSMDAFRAVHRVIGELDELLETGFGGTEADRVRDMVDHVAELEHDVDLLQRELLRELLRLEDSISYGDFWLWTRVIRQLSGISNTAENLAKTVRITLETN